MTYTFDWAVLWREPYGGLIIDGLKMTFYLSLTGWVGALILGTLVGFGRTARAWPVRTVCTAYVEVLRNIPILLQLFFWYFAFPAVLPREFRVHLYSFGWETGSAIVALALYTSSRVAEHIRSGIRSAEVGVRLAALSTGLSRLQAARYVTAPPCVPSDHTKPDLGISHYIQELLGRDDHWSCGDNLRFTAHWQRDISLY